MATRLQLRKGTTTEHSTFIGANGEVTVDTTKKALVLHDGVTAGGKPLPNLINGVIDYNMLPDELLYTPIPYPKTTPPVGYLMMVGQAISSSTYPILYSLYGSTLPDLRGGFIRGWDNGKGVDSGRAILSLQNHAIQNITGSLGSIRTALTTPQLTGAFYLDSGGAGGITGAGGTSYPSVGFDASLVVNTAAETRPRNIAFNYIVKAG